MISIVRPDDIETFLQNPPDPAKEMGRICQALAPADTPRDYFAPHGEALLYDKTHLSS